MKGCMHRIRPCALLLALLLMPTSLAAQEPAPRDSAVVGPVAPQEVGSTYEPPNARAALFKSLIVPGWGQLSVGAPVRGAVYFGIGVTSWAMLVKTIGRLDEVQGKVDDRAEFLGDSLRAEMALDTVIARELSDPEVFDATVEADSLLSDKRGLVGARRQQRQDWIAYTLFFTFLNAVDAYVAAQLMDFPADFEVERRADGSAALGIRIPAGARRRR